MNGRSSQIVAAALAGALFVAAPAARAFVRAKTVDGIPVYWTTNCTTVTIYLNGFTMMSRDETAKSLGAAAHAWSPDAVTCPGADGGAFHPYFEIVPGMAEDTATPPTVGNDGRNVVVFRNNDWPVDLPIDALAVTSLTKKRDGRILDADVEINAEYIEWANLDPASGGHGQTDPFDLQDAMTHEFGHLIGLDHTCHTLADAGRQIDNNGDPVPDCDSAPPDVRRTVMFAVLGADQITQRVLSPDDIAGVCEIYPAARDPKTCSLDLPDDGCGCTAVPPRSAGLEVAISTAISAIAARLRRRARSPRTPVV
jgi:hypothetical protein